LKVLHEVKQGHLTQAAAAEQLGISERWVRELVRRIRKNGDRAVVHGLRGRPSARRISREVQERAVELYRKEYSDFGPTLAAEYLAGQHQVVVSKETLRKWLVGAQVWKVKPRRVKQVYTWRPRRSCRGELVQWDTSEHDWLEGRGEKLYLIAMIDDATNELFAHFAAEDSTGEHLGVLRRYLERHGRPQAFYTDKAGLFRVNPRRKSYTEEMTEPGESQIGRALRELGIELIHAHSPQAKGRVERCFGTLQDRLVKGLRKAGAKTRAEANRYLQKTFLPQWQKRFRREPQELDSILSHVEQRRVANDYTISWGSKWYQIPREAVRPGLRSTQVRVEGRLDGTVWVRITDKTVQAKRCQPVMAEPKLPKAAEPRKDHNRGGRSHWMQQFKLKNAMPG
jgi:transposase